MKKQLCFMDYHQAALALSDAVNNGNIDGAGDDAHAKRILTLHNQATLKRSTRNPKIIEDNA